MSDASRPPAARDRILVALVEPICGVSPESGDLPGFLATIDRLAGGLRPRDRRELMLALRFLEWCVPLVFGVAGRFSHRDRDTRERILAGMAASRLGVLRRLAGALRTLVVFAWYGQRGSWDAIGYDGPWLGRVAVEKLPDPDLGPLS